MTQTNSGGLTVVVGMQFGSEGKGGIAAYLARAASMSVRVGAANAGHTVYLDDKPIVVRQVPAAFVNPNCTLVIGRGAIINLPLLLQEITQLQRLLPVTSRLLVDARAHVTTSEHIAAEQQHDLAKRIASTSGRAELGIAHTRAAKVLRSGYVQAKDIPELAPYVCDTITDIYHELNCGGEILLEGTQGFGLSIEHGDLPFVTSQDTTAQSQCALAGINPAGYDVRTVGVLRTYPIRVAGHSGPFAEGSIELSWDEVTRRSGAAQSVMEHTSVTGLPRRVATFSWQQLDDACFVNRPTELVLTFADYLDASIYNLKHISDPVQSFIAAVEEVTHVPVTIVKTGPQSLLDLDQYRHSLLRRVA